jgi:hypothetical protein
MTRVALRTIPTLGAKCAPKMGHPAWCGLGVSQKAVAYAANGDEVLGVGWVVFDVTA